MKALILLALIIGGCAQKPSAAENSKTIRGVETYISTLPSRGIDGKALNKLAFGSCANQDAPQPLWSTIGRHQTDLFLFMGDNVYASSPFQKPIAEQYRKLDQIAEYRAVREKTPFMAVWDDHDYGQKDGDGSYSGKANARRDFINYWTYIRNSRPLELDGIYHSKIIGPKNKQVQVIMLDTRYFRTDQELLGETQWQWLETELRKPAQIRLLVSSIQFIAEEHRFEKWGNYPKEKKRFLELLKKEKVKNLVILSGDRHRGSIAKMEVPGFGTLYDITASSINRPRPEDENDASYTAPAFKGENFGLAHIDWQNRSLRLELRDKNDQVVNSVQLTLKK